MAPVGVFADAEVAEVRVRYPGLELVSRAVLAGRLDLYAQSDAEVVEDQFWVRIEAPATYPHAPPRLYETGGRMRRIAEKWKLKDSGRLHVNLGGHACVAPPHLERRKFPPGSRLFTYIESLAIPYLFGLHCLERDGHWPFGESSHGALGIIEAFASGDQNLSVEDLRGIAADIRACPDWRPIEIQLRRPSVQRQCPCGSRRPFGECHENAWRGVQHLRGELLAAGMRRLA